MRANPVGELKAMVVDWILAVHTVFWQEEDQELAEGWHPRKELIRVSVTPCLANNHY
jgi:hypothetical protein